jgi:hypothetical protein
MKFIASLVLLSAIKVIIGKRWGGIQNNLAVIDQTAVADSNSFALNAGWGNANANSVSVADNNNNIDQRNYDNDGCCEKKCYKKRCHKPCGGYKWC